MALPQRSSLQRKFQFSTGVLRTVWEVRKETKRHSTVSARRGPEVTRLGGQPDDGHPAPACRWPGSTLPCFSHPHVTLPLSPHSPTLEKNKTTSLYEVPKLGARGGGGADKVGEGPVIQLTVTEHEVLQNKTLL